MIQNENAASIRNAPTAEERIAALERELAATREVAEKAEKRAMEESARANGLGHQMDMAWTALDASGLNRPSGSAEKPLALASAIKWVATALKSQRDEACSVIERIARVLGVESMALVEDPSVACAARDAALARAESAEAEVARLEALFQQTQGCHHSWVSRAEKAESALATEQAGAAAMREALERGRSVLDGIQAPITQEMCEGIGEAIDLANAALATSSGAALLAELTDLRERVSASTAERRKEEIKKLQRLQARTLAACQGVVRRWREAWRSLEHSREWWAARGGRLRAWVMSLPIAHEKRREFFSIVANGTATLDEHPILQQRYQMLTWEADALRAKVEALEREVERHRHGRTIEGDDVCPSELEAANLRARLAEVEGAIRSAADSLETATVTGLYPVGPEVVRVVVGAMRAALHPPTARSPDALADEYFAGANKGARKADAKTESEARP